MSSIFTSAVINHYEFCLLQWHKQYLHQNLVNVMCCNRPLQISMFEKDTPNIPHSYFDHISPSPNKWHKVTWNWSQSNNLGERERGLAYSNPVKFWSCALQHSWEFFFCSNIVCKEFDIFCWIHQRFSCKTPGSSWWLFFVFCRCFFWGLWAYMCLCHLCVLSWRIGCRKLSLWFIGAVVIWLFWWFLPWTWIWDKTIHTI